LASQASDRIERRQILDLPEPKLEVFEHQAEVKTCACRCLNRAAFPPGAAAPVQQGCRLKGTAVYLEDCQLMPFDRLTEIKCDLFACGSGVNGIGIGRQYRWLSLMQTGSPHREGRASPRIMLDSPPTEPLGWQCKLPEVNYGRTAKDPADQRA
jgi:hypothetical protein